MQVRVCYSPAMSGTPSLPLVIDTSSEEEVVPAEGTSPLKVIKSQHHVAEATSPLKVIKSHHYR